jgi:crotonobetainyl-CoA:carnitine CoA-transferase CaiB-like acyl-CoA transferase
MTEQTALPEDFDRPLAGLKVLELSQIMAGPVCGDQGRALSRR